MCFERRGCIWIYFIFLFILCVFFLKNKIRVCLRGKGNICFLDVFRCSFIFDVRFFFVGFYLMLEKVRRCIFENLALRVLVLKRGVFLVGRNDRSVLFLLVCENGWRCCLINRDRKMSTDYIRNGVLYVTEK